MRLGPLHRVVIGAAALACAFSGVALVGTPARAASQLPVRQIEQTLKGESNFSHGVLEVDFNRSDVQAMGGQSQQPFVDGFQLQNEFFFQSLGSSNSAMLNGDMSLKSSEIQPVIDALIARGLVFQAEHQHLYDITPMMWFVHFRGVGNPLTLARKAAAVIARTSTPTPQSSPSNPTSPLPAKKLAHILGGDYTIGDNGVVTITVDRAEKIHLGGRQIAPGLGVDANIQFEPQKGSSTQAVAVPDIAMTASEIQLVLKTMRHYGWESGCLYNQETDESPQLYFDHFFKTGDAITLAQQIRTALDRTNSA